MAEVNVGRPGLWVTRGTPALSEVVHGIVQRQGRRVVVDVDSLVGALGNGDKWSIAVVLDWTFLTDRLGSQDRQVPEWFL